MNAKLPDIKVKIVNCLLSLVITPILSSVNIWSAFYVTYLLINLLINYYANFVTFFTKFAVCQVRCVLKCSFIKRSEFCQKCIVNVISQLQWPKYV